MNLARCLIFYSFFVLGFASNNFLFDELEKVYEIDQNLKDSLPVYSNYLSQGGYFVMPSARSIDQGNLGFIFSYLPPYYLYGANFQLFNRIELSANYWVYQGIIDKFFKNAGFGDRANRAANIKFNLLKKNDLFPFLPEIALGINDFLGSQEFRSFYFAVTQSFLKYNLEVTGGFGTGRMKGFFGGMAYIPWRKKDSFLKNFTFMGEYDCNNYKKCPTEHKKGRDVAFPINLGVHYKLFDVFELSCSSIRGKDVAASLSFNYNLGQTTGLFPKTANPPLYDYDIDHEPLGNKTKSECELIEQIATVLKEQGFQLYEGRMYMENNSFALWLKIVNLQYRIEDDVRERLQYILGSLAPSDIEKFVVAIETDGLISHEYIFKKDFLYKYIDTSISDYEMSIVSPLKNYKPKPSLYESRVIYKKNKRVWRLTAFPKFKTYFGNAKGKFKYDLGLFTGVDGYLFDEIYYNVAGSYVFSSSSSEISARDSMNPSKLINVRSDAVRYYQGASLHLENGYIQKSWNLTNGFFLRLNGGYYEIAYGGCGLECLYYPVHSVWGIGIDMAFLAKRKYSGLGFTNKVYKLSGSKAVKVPFTGFQGFIDVYYEFTPLNLNFTFSLGQFLAKDKGLKILMNKIFSSGLSIGLWYTFTNGNDVVNRERYYDKGIVFSFPLDIFMNKSSKTRVGYAMSAWLRDVGARVSTGTMLQPLLYWERKN